MYRNSMSSGTDSAVTVSVRMEQLDNWRVANSAEEMVTFSEDDKTCSSVIALTPNSIKYISALGMAGSVRMKLGHLKGSALTRATAHNSSSGTPAV
jgi:hypothetical protein